MVELLRKTSVTNTYLFVLSTLLIPASFLNKFFFILCLVFLLIKFFNERKILISTKAPILLFCIFLLYFFYGQIRSNDQVILYQLLMFSITLFLYYYIDNFNINLKNVVYNSGVIFSLFTLFLFFLKLNFIHYNEITHLFEFFRQYGFLSSGYRYFWSQPMYMFHLGTVPFIFLSLSICLEKLYISKNKVNFIVLLLFLIVILLSTSRALYVSVFLLFLLAEISYNKQKINYRLLISLIFLGFIFIYILLNTNFFSANEYSNSIKIDHIKSFLKNMTYLDFMFGRGLAASFYSIKLNLHLINTEIVILDLIRYFGFPISVIIFSLFLRPFASFKDEFQNVNFYKHVFVLYLVLSFSNPILLNSFGAIVIIWNWSNMRGSKLWLKLQ